MTTSNLPISRKAYERFRARIKAAHEAFFIDATPMLRLLDSYLAGRDIALEDVSPVQRYAFMLIIDELDMAMARSARARRPRQRKTDNTPVAEPATQSVDNVDNKTPDNAADIIQHDNAAGQSLSTPSVKTTSPRRSRRKARHAPVRCRYQLQPAQSVYRGVES